MNLGRLASYEPEINGLIHPGIAISSGVAALAHANTTQNASEMPTCACWPRARAYQLLIRTSAHDSFHRPTLIRKGRGMHREQ
jgi:hypothetical protein